MPAAIMVIAGAEDYNKRIYVKVKCCSREARGQYLLRNSML